MQREEVLEIINDIKAVADNFSIVLKPKKSVVNSINRQLFNYSNRLTKISNNDDVLLSKHIDLPLDSLLFEYSKKILINCSQAVLIHYMVFHQSLSNQ